MNTKERLALTLGAALSAAGCSIPTSLDGTYETNLCESDSDCVAGSACVPVGGSSLCAATEVDLPQVVFEVRPVLGGGREAPSLIGPTTLPAQIGPNAIDLNLATPPYVDVSPGRVYLPCGGEVPIPASVHLFPVPVYSGLLAKQTYEAEPTIDDSGNDAFHVSVPPGLYNIYIEPEPDLAATPDCEGSPPIFIPRQNIAKDTAFAVHAGAPYKITGTLQLSQKEDFTKWFLEVVEPISGQTISEVVQPEQTGIALEVPIAIRFDWTARKELTPLIRLRPPEGSGKPTIHWSLAGVVSGVVSNDEIPVKLDVSGIDTQPRQVEGQVLHDNKPVPSTVTLRSNNGPGGDLVRFETVVETDQEGRFKAIVPRREYLVIARPYSTDYAIGTAQWNIQTGEDCFCAKAVEVPSAATLAGSVYGPDGQSVEAEARVTPSAVGALPYLGNMLAADIPPRSASAFTVNGQFKIQVDGGNFDLSIVTPETSGYPWLVRPRQLVALPTTADAAPVVALDPFQLQTPAILRGAAFGSDSLPLRGATIRAWIGVTDPANAAALPSAVQIGEAIADDEGNYILLLPSSIKQGN